jgi:hypothetical protein
MKVGTTNQSEKKGMDSSSFPKQSTSIFVGSYPDYVTEFHKLAAPPGASPAEKTAEYQRKKAFVERGMGVEISRLNRGMGSLATLDLLRELEAAVSETAQ